jgi:hypothetical protein
MEIASEVLTIYGERRRADCERDRERRWMAILLD